MEVITSLDLDSLLFTFSRFVNLRGPVDTIYLDNGLLFELLVIVYLICWALRSFTTPCGNPTLIGLGLPLAPSQGGAWEIMVKLFKKTLNQTIENTRRTPTIIELQTFVIEAVRIINDRPLTTVSDHPNDLSPISPFSFLGHNLSPNTPICGFYDKGDLRNDFLYNATLAHRF